MSPRRRLPRIPENPGPHLPAAIIAGLYVLLGIAWIALSDRLVLQLAADTETLAVLQTYKGIAYVVVTGGLLYLAVYLFMRALARNQKRLLHLNRAHAVLGSVSDVVLHASDDTLLLTSAARAVVDRGDFPLVWIALYDHDSRHLTPVAMACRDHPSRSPGEPIRLTSDSRSIITHALYRGRMRYALGAEDSLVRGMSLPGPEAAAVAAFPLRGGGDTRGVLVIHSAAAELFRDEEEVMLLSRVADTLALGLDFTRQQQRLQRLNYHDPVTGVGNRHLVENRLGAVLNHAAKRNTVVAMLVLDIDDFRSINEAGGHATGNRVLAAVSRMLGGVIRPGDTIGRLGNDEFGIVFHDVPAVGQVNRLVGRVADRFPERLEFDGLELELTVSIGVSVYPNDARDPAELLSRAELALHSGPAGKRSTITYYAPELDRRASEQRALETALRNAVFEAEFRLAWQPVVAMGERAGCVRGAEALLRWHSPQLGEIPPIRFIPVAEQIGRIRTLGNGVLERACAQGQAWAQEGQPLDVAVNIALDQLQDADFVSRVRRLLERHGGSDWALVLELTESQFMMDPEPVSAVCRQLRELGCRIHLDDFGTGYSALNYLVHLPLDGIKLDRSFVRQIETDHGVRAVTEAAIALAGKLGLEVIAEGVETEQQLVILRQLGASNLQGYLFGRPMTATDVSRLAADAARGVLAN